MKNATNQPFVSIGLHAALILNKLRLNAFFEDLHEVHEKQDTTDPDKKRANGVGPQGHVKYGPEQIECADKTLHVLSIPLQRSPYDQQGHEAPEQQNRNQQDHQREYERAKVKTKIVGISHGRPRL